MSNYSNKVLHRKFTYLVITGISLELNLIKVIHHDMVDDTPYPFTTNLFYDNEGLYFLYRTPFSDTDTPTRYNLNEFK